MDGGSSDDSLSIIQKYEKWLAYWVSEADEGQASAVNSGFRKTEGEIFGWLCSDDYFEVDAFANLVELQQENPESVGWVGSCMEVDLAKNKVRKPVSRVGNKRELGSWGTGAWFPQPSCLFSSKLFYETGGLDERLYFAEDVDLWIRLSERGGFSICDKVISYVHVYPETKTLKNIPMREAEMIVVNWNNGMAEIAGKRMTEFAEIYYEFSPKEILVRVVFKILRPIRNVLERIFFGRDA